ncbi:ABC transporter permease [Enterocloster aldenensis]|jgi:NitT/TauT family transport system permease protein|uniref:ABC transporter permease n=1 Tax=Enterocloster aldenensis TaxID=358742 RepID=UPI000E4E05B8|nr:ABC transporter permease subunit [Enterocloster aldenensis]
MNQNTRIRKYFIWLLWIAIWQAANLLIHNNIIFVGPADMAAALLELVHDSSFWASVLHTFAKISIGFLGAFILSILLGCLAYALPLVKDLLEPMMLLIKSVPVASFVILALIWIGSHNLAVFTSFLVVVPMIYVSTLSGLEHTDRKLLEMAQVFHMPLWKQIRYIYLPSVLPYLISGCRTALGMSWKSGVAAEVIGIPEGSIGEQLYYSKLYLDTAGLFAWTFVIIIASAVFERLFLFLLGKIKH